MYKVCPKCHYKRQASDTVSEDQCPGCGLVFSKWMKQRFQLESSLDEKTEQASESFLRRFFNTVLAIPPQTDYMVLYGRTLLFIVFFFWGWSFILMDMKTNEIGQSFMHNINLVFHEAGHVVFRIFGQFMMVLGGTLGQLIIPVIVIVAFIWKNQDNFGASIGLWWLGQSMMDVAPYINDARAGQIMLLGGVTGQDAPGFHDWRNILHDLNMLEQDHAVARVVDTTGEIIMILSMIWGGYILFRLFQQGR